MVSSEGEESAAGGYEEGVEEDEEKEISGTEENEADVVSEDDEKEDTNRRLDKSNNTGDKTKPGEPKGENIMDDSDERNEERTKLVQTELNFRMPEMEHRLHRGAEVAQSIEEEIETGHSA